MPVPLNPWVVSFVFAAIMSAAWVLGWFLGKRCPKETEEDPGRKFTDASMALLGLLLAFTFSMALGRHEERRKISIDDCNAISDFYTCAGLLQGKTRTQLMAVIREYALLKLETGRRSAAITHEITTRDRYQKMHARMGELVAVAVAEGTPIAVPLTNTYNSLTSNNTAMLAVHDAKLPLIIVVLLLLGAAVPSLLLGLQQGASRTRHFAATFCFIILVTVVVYVTLDLNLPSMGFIRINYDSLERLVQSMTP